MPKQKLYLILLFSILALISTAVFTFYSEQNIDERVAYESFLREHPYNKNDPDFAKMAKGGEKGKELERSGPAQRMRQDFMMTMDPALQRPTPELLPQLINDLKSARTYGTLPGESTAPWVERGPNNVGGRTRALMWDPNDLTGKKVWAGGVAGGLWFNNDITNASSQWNKVDDFWTNLAVTCIAFDPNNPQIFYVGTGEGFTAGGGSNVRGHGIWKTTNGGVTWTQLNASTDFYYVNDLVVRNAGGSSELYAGVVIRYQQGVFAGSSQGLFKSTDSGATFTQTLPATSGVSDIEIGSDGTIWVGTDNSSAGSGGGKILKSSDGNSWTMAYSSTSSGRVELAVAPSADTVVYAMIENEGAIFEMKRTSDAGSTWVNLAFPNDDDTGIEASDFTRGQAWYDLIAAVDPTRDSTVIVGGINLHMSTDAGQTWQQISKWSNNPNMGSKPYSFVHADQHAIQFKAGSSLEVIFGNDGGVFWTNDFSNPANTDKIVARNNNYNVTQFYANAIHPDKAKHYFLAGAQDNGTQRFQVTGINSTDEVSGGDGGYTFIDQTNGEEQITAYTNNNFYFTDNSWLTDVTIVGDDLTGRFINPADYDDELNILYTASTETAISRFSRGATGFTRFDIAMTLETTATHLKVSPHTRNSTTLYVGTAAGRVFRVNKANTASAVITEITASNFPTGWVSCIQVGQDENHLLVTFSNYGVTSVWYTADGGTTWVSKEGDLPNIPVRWALFNPTNFDEVILATEMGVWGTKSITAASPTWAQFSNGLANVRVDMLQMRDSDYEVIAATHGRGLYSSSVFAGQATLTSNFVAKNRATELNTAVEFLDRSKGATSWAWTFAGGTPSTSTEQNPSVTYAVEGAYTVTLVANSASGGTSTKTIEGYIQVGPTDDGPLEALFTSDIQTVVQGGEVVFTNGSKGMPDSYIWFFEGGTPSASTALNPIVKYESTGPYDVELIVFKDGKQNNLKKTNFISVAADNSALRAKFKANTLNVFVGNQVKFTDVSTGGATSWNWTFEGGNPATSTSQNPVVEYATSGKFDVTLKVTKGTETNTLVMTNFIGAYVSKGIEFSDVVVDSHYSGANPDFASFYGGTGTTAPTLVSPQTVVPGNTDSFLSLPIGTYVTVAFVDNEIINAPNQDDIFVKEFEGINEYANVYVSANGIDFSFIGTAIGTSSSNVTTTFDLQSINFQQPVKAIKVVGLDLGGASPGYDLLSISGIAGAIIGNTPPDAPTLLAGVALPSEVKLTWEDNAIDESGFTLERSTDGTTFTKVKDLPINSISYTNGGLLPGTKFFFRVKAVNKNGDSGFSNIVEVTTGQFTVEAPTDLTAAANSSVTVRLDWKDNSVDEETFEIQRSADNDQFTTLASVPVDSIFYDDLGLTASTIYFYRVKGINSSGESDYTNSVEIKTLDPLEPPSALALVKATGRKVELSWTDNAIRETGFVIERAVGTGSFALLTDLEPDAVGFTDTNVLELTDYKYRVYAVNDTLENSLKTASLSVSTPERGFPDLAFTDVSVPAFQSAKMITLGATVSNFTDDPTEVPFEVSFYISSDEELTFLDELLGVVSFDVIAEGGEQTASDEFEMLIVPKGEYFIIAIIDEADNIEEEDESNNQESASIVATEVLSVSDELKQNVTVYPNPATSVLNVVSSISTLGPIDMQLTDLSGKVLKKRIKMQGTTKLDIADLPVGLYLLTLNKEGGQTTFRILKQ